MVIFIYGSLLCSVHLNVFNTGMPAYLLSFILFNNGPERLGFCSVHRKETVGVICQIQLSQLSPLMLYHMLPNGKGSHYIPLHIVCISANWYQLAMMRYHIGPMHIDSSPAQGHMSKVLTLLLE